MMMFERNPLRWWWGRYHHHIINNNRWHSNFFPHFWQISQSLIRILPLILFFGCVCVCVWVCLFCRSNFTLLMKMSVMELQIVSNMNFTHDHLNHFFSNSRTTCILALIFFLWRWCVLCVVHHHLKMTIKSLRRCFFLKMWKIDKILQW